jgi:ribonuclease D
MKWSFPKAQYIDEPDELSGLLATLADESLLAVDTESNSLHAYQEQVCLIQLSTRTADYIIDPLRVDVQPLGALMANPAIEKIFHAAEYDVICLKRDYGFAFANLFDTMQAARICGYQLIGLGNLLEEHLDVRLDKSHQRDNWGRRPLPEDSLRYAQADTHYLPTLRDRLLDRLGELGRVEEAREMFQDVCNLSEAVNEFDPNGFWRIGYPNQLSRRQMAVLRQLYLLREGLAEKRDTPPFKVFSDKTLLALTEVAPRRIKDLDGLPGMTPAQIRRYGRQILKAVSKGEKDKPPKPPPRQPPADPEAVECYSALREWRKLRARQRGVESDVIISKDTLWTLAHTMPDTLEQMRDINGLGPWRLEMYGSAMLEVLQQYKK